MWARFSPHAAASRIGNHGVNIVIAIRFKVDVEVEVFVRDITQETVVRGIRGCYIVSVG